MSLKAKIEAIIYAAEEPVTVDQIMAVVGDELSIEKPAQPVDNVLRIDSAERVPEAPAEDQHALGDTQEEARQQRDRGRRHLREILDQLAADYDSPDHGMEIRQVAGGYRMSTKPEHHDVVRTFAKSLKPPIRLSLQALETLAVIAYKQPVTGPEISEIRGVDCSGVLASLLSRKLITTAGRKQVIGRPILYKTTKDFLLRFGLKDLSDLPSIEEFEKLTAAAQNDLLPDPEVARQAAPPEVQEQVDQEGHDEEKIIETPRASNE